MINRDVPDEGTLGSKSLPGSAARSIELGTETIDLGELFTSDVSQTGSFDLCSIEEAALGKLLHAIPVPIVLVDHWQHVVFANQSCNKIGGADYRDIVGLPVTDLIATPLDSDKIQSLNARTVSLFDKAFTTRRPQKAEAIIEMNGGRMWCRLHLRAIRVESVRYILVALEDLTVEKVQLRLGQRNEKKLMRTYTELSELLKERNNRLFAVEEQLRTEAAQHSHIAEQLRAERGRFHALCAYMHCGVARLALDGALIYCNAVFKEIVDAKVVPGGAEDSGFAETTAPMTAGEAVSTWIRSMTDETRNVRLSRSFAVQSNDTHGREVRVDAIKLDSEYLLTCSETPPNALPGLNSPRTSISKGSP